MSIFSFFRKVTPKKDKIYPRTYVVRVSLSHPKVIGHIQTIEIAIDAHSGSHARRQLKEELKLVVGRVDRSWRTPT